MSACRSCGAAVAWVETEARPDKPGRKMPLDAGDDGRPQGFDDGNIVLTGARTGDGTPIARYVPKGPGRLRTHFVSCPNAKGHRKP